MNIKPIRNDADLRTALARLDTLWGAAQDTPEGDELDVLVLLVEKFEDEHYPIGPSDPVEAIKFRMEQAGLTPKDLVPMIGRLNRVYEVLNRKRSLTLAMIWKLHNGLGIPAESLIRPPSPLQSA